MIVRMVSGSDPESPKASKAASSSCSLGLASATSPNTSARATSLGKGGVAAMVESASLRRPAARSMLAIMRRL